MALLSTAAIDGIREYLCQAISYAKYKVGGVYYQAETTSVSVLADGSIAVDFLIDQVVPGQILVTEVQLYDTDDQLWFSKPESLIRHDAQEGILYRVILSIEER